jgi:hypothetical protein
LAEEGTTSSAATASTLKSTRTATLLAVPQSAVRPLARHCARQTEWLYSAALSAVELERKLQPLRVSSSAELQVRTEVRATAALAQKTAGLAASRETAPSEYHTSAVAQVPAQREPVAKSAMPRRQAEAAQILRRS